MGYMLNGENWIHEEDIPELDWEGFSFKNYREGELNILAPQLERLGYTIVAWAMGESDSFGPLSRIAFLEKEGIPYNFCYG